MKKTEHNSWRKCQKIGITTVVPTMYERHTKRLPEGELSIMLKIWNENRPLYLEEK